MPANKLLKIILFLLFSWTLIQIVAPAPVIPLKHHHSDILKIKYAPKYIVEVIQIDPAFTDQEKFLISQAALEWQNATNNIVKFVFMYDTNYNFKIRIEQRPTAINIFHLQPEDEDQFVVEYLDYLLKAKVIGYYDEKDLLNPDMITMFVVRSRIQSEDEYKSVIMHEIGHSLGLGHNKNPNALMYRISTGLLQCITSSDLNKFCEIYNCDAEQLNPCLRTEELICSNEDSL